jgi:hypothetical protein
LRCEKGRGKENNTILKEINLKICTKQGVRCGNGSPE